MTATTQPTKPETEPTARLAIEVWTDVVCPWCYIAAPRLERAIAASEHADAIEVITRSFELDPSATQTTGTNLDVVAAKYGLSPAQAMQGETEIQQLAAAEGRAFQLERPHGYTGNLHRLLHLANEYGVRNELMAALMDALFAKSVDLFGTEAPIELAASLGVPEARAREVLAGDDFADAVAEDRRAGLELGLRGVPFVVFGRKVAVPGGASVEQYAAAIERTWEAS